MSILTNWGRKLKMLAVPIALGALAACATPFNADVQRFQSALPAPQGQTFTVVADDPALAGGLEFSQYAHQVADQMAHLGYTPVNSVDQADLLVRFDYGVDKGRQRVRQTGFSDPFFDNGLDVYTVYTSGIDLKIDRRATGERLFEGKAEAVSTSNRLQYLVPNLVQAMFTDFPGRSGETIRISIAPEDKAAQRRR
jgi:hypothetical protein